MITAAAVALSPVGIALLVVAASFGACVVIGKAIHQADVEQPARTERFDWLAPIDLTDDGADTRRSPSTEAAHRQALALGKCRPLAEAVIDELAQRRSVTS